MLKIIKIFMPIFVIMFSSATNAAVNITIEKNNKKLARELILGMQEPYNFKLTKEVNLPHKKYYKFSQYYDGIAILDTGVVTTSDDIKVIKEADLVDGNFMMKVEDDVTSVDPKISKEEAIKIATAGVTTDIKSLNVELTMKTYDGVARLVYIVDYYINDGIPKRPYYVIDANTGEVIETWDGLNDSANNPDMRDNVISLNSSKQ